MPQLQIVCPLRLGTQERWRRLYQIVQGSRRDQFEASCRHMGITGVQVRLMHLHCSELMLMTLNIVEPIQTLQELETSERPFDCWLREQIHSLLGWNMQDSLHRPQNDLVFTWSGDTLPS